MTIIRCKMCGGDLSVIEGNTVCECEYCGTRQTVPNVDDDKKLKLFERANKLRANCEFDKAAGVYENIVSEYPEEAEGYWGLILCRYGIEYVDDPATGKKIPTSHRTSFDSIMDDEDFEMVMENSDAVSRSVYREEAKYIEILHFIYCYSFLLEQFAYVIERLKERRTYSALHPCSDLSVNACQESANQRCQYEVGNYEYYHGYVSVHYMPPPIPAITIPIIIPRTYTMAIVDRMSPITFIFFSPK